jgi:hypothetical protein
MADVSVCEKCRKTEFQDKVTLKRCGQCKVRTWRRLFGTHLAALQNVFYCSPECQKGDWKDHKYYCRKPDAVLRKEGEKGFMGMKNAINVPVDVDPETGDFDVKPLVERIKADQQKIGKSKVSAPPAPKTWAYKPPETEEEREEKMRAYEKQLDMAKFAENEKLAWKYLLSSDDKDFVWALWQLFSEGDAELPLERANTRCARELIRLAGRRADFVWLGKKGNSFVGLEQNDRERDPEISAWIRKVAKEQLGSDLERGFDCTLLTRFFCVRRFMYDKE